MKDKTFPTTLNPKELAAWRSCQSCDEQLLGEQAHRQLQRNSAAAAEVLQETWLQDVPKDPFPTPAP